MKGRLTRKQADLILRGTEDDWVNYIVLECQCRVPKLEPYIAQFPRAAYVYARWSIRGRFPEGEPLIAKDPWEAYRYAEYVIGGRWPEAEATIRQNPIAWKWYTDLFLWVNR